MASRGWRRPRLRLAVAVRPLPGRSPTRSRRPSSSPSSSCGVAAQTSGRGWAISCWRQPIATGGLTAKMISTIDVICGGRAILGIGAGWKEDEWLAYGYGFPGAGERLDILADHLEVITRMMAPGRATFERTARQGRWTPSMSRRAAMPRIPIVVGGNGRERTWRLAARYADELDLDALMPDQVGAALPVIPIPAREIGRDPRPSRCRSTCGARPWSRAGAERQQRLREYAEWGWRVSSSRASPSQRTHGRLTTSSTT